MTIETLILMGLLDTKWEMNFKVGEIEFVELP